MAKLMKLFTPTQIKEVLTAHTTDRAAASEFTRLSGKGISRQLVRYWREIFLTNSGSQAKADKALREQMRLISPSPEDDIGDLSFIPDCAERILFITDLHAPYTHPDYLDFCKAVAAEVQPDLVVQAGDELDQHSLSFHDSDPNLDSAGAELEKAKGMVEQWHAAFPNMLLCNSNHGSMIYRRAKAHGLPVQYIKKYRDVLFPEHGAPGWSWRDGWKINTPLGLVLFKHQASGDVVADAAHEGCNVAVGHEHGQFKIGYAASSTRLYWGMVAGCGIDRKSLAFAYGKHTKNKPMLGCAVIMNGEPVLVPMVMDESGRWVGAKHE